MPEKLISTDYNFQGNHVFGLAPATEPGQPVILEQIEEMFDFTPSNPWQEIAAYSSEALGAIISPPPASAFVSLGGITAVKRLEIWLKDLVATEAPASLIFAIYSSQGSGVALQTRLLTTIGVTAGENGASVLSGNAFIQAGCIFVDVNQSDPDLKFAVAARHEPTAISIAVDQYNGDSNAKWLGANPGFSSTGVRCRVSVNGSVPAGLCTQAKVLSNSANTFSLVGPSLPANHPLRLNFFTLPAFYAPPVGISGICQARDINTSDNTINVKGCVFDFSLMVNTSVRFRVAPNSTLPSLNNGAIAAGTTYYLINCTGLPGNQTFQLSIDGSVPAEITAPGVGFFAMFPYPVVFGLTLNGSNQLVYNGSVIDIKPAVSQAATVTAGVASVFTDNAHGYAADDAIILTATTTPTGALLNGRYFVCSNGLTANTFKVAGRPGGLPIAMTAAGAGISWVKESTGVGRAANMTTVGVASVVTSPAAYIGNSVPFTLTATTTIPGAAYTYGTLTATFVSANTFTAQQRIGLGSIAFETTGAGTITVEAQALNLGGAIVLEPTEVWVKGTGEGEMEVALSSGGASINSQSIGTGIIGISPIEQPSLSGQLLARAAA